MNRASFEQFILTNGVKRSHLNQECPRVVAIKIADKVIDWKMLGNVLGLPREKISAIERENQTEDQRKVAVFDEWKSSKGSEATYLELAEAMYDRHRRDLVEMLCYLFKKHETTPTEVSADLLALPEEQTNDQARAATTTIVKRIESLENKFQELHTRLVSELTSEGKISVDTMLQALTMLPVALKAEYDDLVQQRLSVLEEATSLHRLFLRLNPLFTFIDYPGLLNHLISRFGSVALKSDMMSYERDIQVFMCNTTVAELMDHWPGRQDSNLVIMKVKFDDNPQNCTLQKLNDFRRKFACEIRLSEFIFTVIGFEPSNSFVALWGVPSVVVHIVIENCERIGDEFYQCEGVLSLHVGEAQLFPSKVQMIVKHYDKVALYCTVIHCQSSGPCQDQHHWKLAVHIYYSIFT